MENDETVQVKLFDVDGVTNLLNILAKAGYNETPQDIMNVLFVSVMMAENTGMDHSELSDLLIRMVPYAKRAIDHIEQETNGDI